MIIRPATPADFGPAARVAVSTYINDPLEDYLYPNRKNHPISHRSSHETQIRKFASQKDNHVIVAELEPSDAMWKGSKEIVGYVEWHIRKEEPNKSFWKRFIEGIENCAEQIK